MSKKPFDIDVVMGRIESAVRPYPRAALFELADDGYRSPFQQLIACIISIRTLDEVTVVAARRLLESASTAEDVARLDIGEIDALIHDCAFHWSKAGQIREIATRAAQEPSGELPCDFDWLTSLPGVGPKCANLMLGIACGDPRIGVDIHVHRVTNRWGYVHAASPLHTMAELEAKLPRRYWLSINALLVPFGKHICTGRKPACSTCPVLEMCQQVGVIAHR